MKIQNKECDYVKINLNLDKSNYLALIKELKIIGQKYEALSNTDKLNYTAIFNGIKTPDMQTGGWSNRCEDFKFCIFIDFDNHAFWQVQAQLEMLMEKFNLSPFYIFQTESELKDGKKDFQGDEYGSYNCVCLTKQRFIDVFKIQDETTCDQAHKNLPKLYHFHSAILRNKPKGSKGAPVFKCIIGDINKEYSQDISSAHLNFLYELDKNIPKIKYTKPDGFKALWLSDYSTSSK